MSTRRLTALGRRLALPLAALAGSAASQQASAQTDPDAAAWEAARAAGTAAACQRYLEEFPVGRYVEEAFRCVVEAALPPAAPVAPRTAAPLVEPPRRPLAGPGDAGELFPFLLLPPIGPAIPPAEPVVPPAELY